jgi:hypothetical protein
MELRLDDLGDRLAEGMVLEGVDEVRLVRLRQAEAVVEVLDEPLREAAELYYRARGIGVGVELGEPPSSASSGHSPRRYSKLADFTIALPGASSPRIAAGPGSMPSAPGGYKPDYGPAPKATAVPS